MNINDVNKITKNPIKPQAQERPKDFQFEHEKGNEMLVDNVANRSMVQQPDAQTRFKNEVLKNENLDDYTRQGLIKGSDKVTEENIEYKRDIIKKTFDKYDLTDNFSAQMAFMLLVFNVDNKSQYEIADMILSSDALMAEPEIVENISEFAKMSQSEPKANLMKKFLSKPELHENKYDVWYYKNYIEKLDSSDFELEQRYSYKVMDKILTDELYKDKKIMYFVKNIQESYKKANLSPELREAKDRYLYNIITNPNITDYDLCKQLYQDIETEKDADLLAREDVLNFIIAESQNQHFFIHKDMEDDTYNIQTFKKGHTNIIKFEISDNGINVKNKTVMRGVFKEKKENADGSYVVSDVKRGRKYKTVYDDAGVPKYSEVIKSNNKKQYEIVRYERGLDKSMSKQNEVFNGLYGSKSQGEKVEREFETADGIKTHHKSIQGPKGFMLEYSIKDNEGKLLAEMNKKHRIIDERHTESIVNGDKYEVYFPLEELINFIEVTKTSKTGEKETVTLDAFHLDPTMRDLYRNLSGDVLFGLQKHGVKTFLGSSVNSDDAYYYIGEGLYYNSITLPEAKQNDKFTFMHEYGHALDYHNGEISNNDKELRKIVLDELNQFRKESSNGEEEAMNYFLRPFDEDGKGSVEGGIEEIVAETVALLSSASHTDNPKINERSILLQKHFPKTIAFIINNLT